MSLRFTLLPLRLLGLSFLSLPSAVAAQAPASDSTNRASVDSQAAHPDSAAATDTSGAPGADGRGAWSDSARAGTDTISDTAKVSLEAADSILVGACSGPSPATVARDLLVIVFGTSVGAGKRAAAARSVNGKLLGPVTGEPDAYYLRVPGGGRESRLRAAADELIQLPQVRQVGSRACPRLPSPAETRPNPPS